MTNRQNCFQHSCIYEAWISDFLKWFVLFWKRYFFKFVRCCLYNSYDNLVFQEELLKKLSLSFTKTNLENLSCGTKHPCSIETDMFAQRNKCMMLLRKTKKGDYSNPDRKISLIIRDSEKTLKVFSLIKQMILKIIIRRNWT